MSVRFCIMCAWSGTCDLHVMLLFSVCRTWIMSLHLFFFLSPILPLWNQLWHLQENKNQIVMSKFGSVRFFTLFLWTVNWTLSPVQVILVNRGPNARFGSNFGPVLVLGSPNREPNLYIFQKMSKNTEIELKHLELIVRCLLSVQGYYKGIRRYCRLPGCRNPIWCLLRTYSRHTRGFGGPQIFLSSAYLCSWSRGSS